MAHGTVRNVVILAAVLLILILPGGVAAQYGHPLKGQWSGYWGPEEQGRRLLLDLQWDGKAITGKIDPGGNEATVRQVTFDYSNPAAWKVRLEAERRDPSGKPVRIVAEGTLENIGSYFRVFRGTWTEGSEKAPFTVTRN